MTKQLKMMTRTIIGMFLVLLVSITMIQVVQAEELGANENNRRTAKNAFKVQRGAILVQGAAIASSTPTDDSYLFQRTYSDGQLYAPATGYFSRYQGMTGIESVMNDDLSGLSAPQFLTRMQRIVTGEKPQGSAVELTLNDATQRAAYEAMSGYEGAIVVTEIDTGKIRAFVSTPTFDPNLLSSNDNLSIIENYSLLANDPNQPLANRVIAGDLYHPGSTYKLVTTAAALESGAATPATEFPNPAAFTLPDTPNQMQNFSRGTCGPGETVSLERSLIYSCNIPFAELAIQMDTNVIPNMAKAFGYEQDLEIPLPVTPSVAPLPDSAAAAAQSAIGQLDVRSTPLQVAMISAGIANKGVVMKPQLVEQVIAPDLQVERTFEAQEFSTPISEATAAQLTDMMEKTVGLTEGSAHRAAIPGVRVAGKTGTAENGETADGVPLPYTLWFTGFAPVENPKFAIAVVVANGGGEKHNYEGTSYDVPTLIGKRVMEAVLNQ